MKSMLLSAAACLFAASAALAQTPAPAGLPTAVSPMQPGSGTCLTGTCLGGCRLFGKCEPGKPCTPVYLPTKKTVYSTVTREYCLANRSLCDLLMWKCGMVDDCENAPTGETRTKTLLVKKLVPKCDDGCCTGARK